MLAIFSQKSNAKLPSIPLPNGKRIVVGANKRNKLTIIINNYILWKLNSCVFMNHIAPLPRIGMCQLRMNLILLLDADWIWLPIKSHQFELIATHIRQYIALVQKHQIHAQHNAIRLQTLIIYLNIYTNIMKLNKNRQMTHWIYLHLEQKYSHLSQKRSFLWLNFVSRK